MDRRTWRPRAVKLANAFVLLTLTGCAQLEEIGSGRIFTSSAKEKSSREPKAETYVAFGDLRANAGMESNCVGNEREMVLNQARCSYQKALETDPMCIRAYLSLGRLYQDMQKPDKAIAVYQQGIDKMPREKELWFELGMCQARFKQWDASLDSLGMASQLDPENPKYQNVLGFCLARAGRYEECLDHFKRSQGAAKAHYNVARMLRHVERTEDARHHLQLALQADPKLHAARQMLVSLNSNGATQPARSGAILTVSFDESIDEAAQRFDSE